MLLTWLFSSSRSIENPSTPLSAPDDWLGDALGSFKASSGARVNRETALTLSAIWRGVSLIARDCGKLPCFVEKRAGPRGWNHDHQHPAYYLLRHRPNDVMTAFVFRQAIQGHAVLDGNGYAYISRLASGAPEQLLLLMPRQVTPLRVNGRLWYVYQFLDGEQRKIPGEDIIHIKGFSYDGLVGYNLVHKAREQLGGYMARQTFGNIFFRNNARPNVVLTTPARLSDKARLNLRESWERMGSGLENSHRTAILEEGVNVKELSINARDAQLIAALKMDLIDVANFLGVPVHKVGGEGRTAYNSLEQENQAYLDEGLDPWLIGHEEEYREKLLTEEEKRTDSHRMRFERKELLRANLEGRGNYYVRGRQWGWLSVNDIRHEEGQNPVDGEAGETYLTPLNMVAVKAGSTIGPSPATPAVDGGASGQPRSEPSAADSGERRPVLSARWGPVLGDAVRRIITRFGHQAERAAAKPGRFLDWLDQLADQNQRVVLEAFLPVQRAALGDGVDLSQAGAWLIEKVRAGYLEMSGKVTPIALPLATAQLTAQLLDELPAAAAAKFLGEPR
jgi:HK97 family phage portal protein